MYLSHPASPARPPSSEDDAMVIDATWVAPSSTRNWCRADPLLDWLGLYGPAAGWHPDDDPAAANDTIARPRYDPALDFGRFIMEQGRRFESGVVRLLRERFEVHQIGYVHGYNHGEARDPALVGATKAAMIAGAPMIYQPVLIDPVLRTYGMADLLVRSDVLAELFPDEVGHDEAALSAPALAAHGDPTGWHYRVVDIKFTTLSLMRDGHASKDLLPYQVQVWLYNEALGRLQGLRPDSCYLLGRNWASGSGRHTLRGRGCLEHLARIDAEHLFGGPAGAQQGESLAGMAAAALAWRQRVQDAPIASRWEILGHPDGPEGRPVPSVIELYPNMSNGEDAPWHSVKAHIAQRLAELTRLPGVGVERRNAALARGLARWDDPAMSAEAIGVTTPAFGARLRGVLAANLLPGDRGAALVLPAHLDLPDASWRTPAPLEFFVDFETTSNLADDFRALPAIGGQPLIFQIGCGHLEPIGDASTGVGGINRTGRPGEGRFAVAGPGPSDAPEGWRWVFAQWTVDLLEEAQEARIIEDWLAHMRSQRAARGLSGADERIFHWSPAEMTTLESAYNSARVRRSRSQPSDEPWPDQPFYDLLDRVVHAGPVTVKGAFGFGLKAVTHAMHAAGLIEVVWNEGPADGLGAMVGAWSADAAARAALAARAAEITAKGVALTAEQPISGQPLMRSIGAYNEVDCHAMAEILWWLRRNR